MNDFVLTQAYGRVYKSKKEVLEALNSGKDFMANSRSGSCYVSIRDLPNGEFLLRYGKGSTKVMVAKINNHTAK